MTWKNIKILWCNPEPYQKHVVRIDSKKKNLEIKEWFCRVRKPLLLSELIGWRDIKKLIAILHGGGWDQTLIKCINHAKLREDSTLKN